MYPSHPGVSRTLMRHRKYVFHSPGPDTRYNTLYGCCISKMYKYLLKRKCAVLDCPITGRNKETKLFRLPRNLERYYKWAHFTRNPHLMTKQRKAAFICGYHFELDQFRDELHQLLKYSAMPTLRPGHASPGPVSAAIPASAELKMECKDNSLLGNASAVFVKEEVNEGQWWQEDMSSEVKCKSEELPISELHSCSSATVSESKANVVYSNGHKMDFKKEIKEEPGCLDISTEIKSEPEEPSVSATDLEDQYHDSWIVAPEEGFPSRMSQVP